MLVIFLFSSYKKNLCVNVAKMKGTVNTIIDRFCQTWRKLLILIFFLLNLFVIPVWSDVHCAIFFFFIA